MVDAPRRPQGSWRRAALATCCGLLVAAGGSVELVDPLELVRRQVERFGSDVTFLQIEPATLEIYASVETRATETLERRCADIAASARDLLPQWTLKVFLRSDARTQHVCRPVSLERDERETPGLVLPMPRAPSPRPDGLCIGDCMLLWGGPLWLPESRSPDAGQPEPLVRLEPRYPARALEERIEGWVLLRFSISELGSVVDPVVVASEPAGVFDRAAVRAVSRWKYRRPVEGVPRHGVQEVVVFELSDDRPPPSSGEEGGELLHAGAHVPARGEELVVE